MSPVDKRCFDYFTNTSANMWDALEYHKTWKARGFPLDKATLTRTLGRQLDWILLHDSSDQKSYAAILKNEFKVRIFFLQPGSTDLQLATGLRLPRGYGLRLRCNPTNPVPTRDHWLAASHGTPSS